jgi:hypothetical protein
LLPSVNTRGTLYCTDEVCGVVSKKNGQGFNSSSFHNFGRYYVEGATLTLRTTNFSRQAEIETRIQELFPPEIRRARTQHAQFSGLRETVQPILLEVQGAVLALVVRH